MVKPDTVFVELCLERAESLRRQAVSSSTDDSNDDEGSFLKVIGHTTEALERNP
jgi:pheromone shutdown protein TraB